MPSALYPLPSFFMVYPFSRSIYPFLIFIMLLEIMVIRISNRSSFSWQETLASFGVAIGHKITMAMFAVIPMGMYAFIWQHRLWTIPLNNFGSICCLFLGVEFFYYWHHRFAHEVRWLWTTHAVHHSSRHFNLSTSSRLGWTGWLSGNFLFFLPLCWLGFNPTAISLTLGINLLYQFWIHTELIPKLGWFELVFNTPSHHRVHHASNPEYIDRNYGGVLIIFDRLFGTFTAEQSPCSIIYGLTHPLKSHNPFQITFHEWVRLFRELANSESWYDRYKTMIKRPK